MQDENYLLSLRLFGSRARSEEDENSDIDILIVTNKPIDGDDQNITKKFKLTEQHDISIYSDTRIIEMFTQGHLFAWHLFLESKPLNQNSDENWFNSLGKPTQYCDAHTDIKQFSQILREAILRFYGGHSAIFDAGICYLACRNLGLFLSFQLLGRPDFSRTSALHLPNPYGLKLAKDEFNKLKTCRTISKQGGDELAIDLTDVAKYIDIIAKWLTTIEENYDF